MQEQIEGFHVHWMRRTCRCQWTEQGRNLAALQQILGHASIETTQRYARLSDEAVMREAQRLGRVSGVEASSQSGARQMVRRAWDPRKLVLKPGGLAMLLAGFLVATGCSGGRPREAEASRIFLARYPGVEILSVKNTEDEVIATSYDFEYRIKETGRVGRLWVQFTKDDAGSWVPNPSMPDSLP